MSTLLKAAILEAAGLYGEESETNPYVVIAAGRGRFKTQVTEMTCNPVWDEAFSIDMKDSKKVLVTVWTKADAGDRFLGLLTLDVAELPLDGSQNWYELQGRRGKDDLVSGEPRNLLPSVVVKSSDAKKANKSIKDKVADAVSMNELELDLSGLELSIIPPALSAYHTNWQMLDLGFNAFSTWPNLGNFHNLSELWLTGNKMRNIGDDLAPLASLKTLYLMGNLIARIPTSIKYLTNLEKLELQNNRLITLPSEFGALTTLEELNLSGNEIEEIPQEFGELSYLELLDLSGNKLKSLPSKFPGCIRLLELNLGNNAITKLPGDFGNMSRLVSLNLADNKLTDLPLSMGACVHLDSVLLERNPIKDKALMQKYAIGTDHLNDYLQKRLFAFTQDQKRRKRELERAKKAAAKLRGDGGKKKKVEAIPESRRLDGFQDDDEDLTDEQKHAKIRAHSQKLAGECKHEVITLKRNLMRADKVEEILPIARAIRDLMPFMNDARMQMAPIPKPKPPMFQGTEDKLTKLKKTTAVALREFESVLGGIFNVVSGNVPLEQLIPLSSVITGSLSILQEATKGMDDQ